MSTTFTWTVNNLERTTADGIVNFVHYTVYAADDTYSASAYGSVGLETEAAAGRSGFISYGDLTPEVVVEWVKERIGGKEKVAELEAALQNQLDEQRAPTQASGVPWS